MKPTFKLSASRAAKDLTIEVEVIGMRLWTFRLFLGLAVIRAGVWLAGMGFDFKVRKPRKALAMLLLVVLFGGCKSLPLTPDEARIRILKGDAPDGCVSVGRVTAPGLGAWSPEGPRDDLRRMAAKLGADVVELDERDENGTLYGTAYKCP